MKIFSPLTAGLLALGIASALSTMPASALTGKAAATRTQLVEQLRHNVNGALKSSTIDDDAYLSLYTTSRSPLVLDRTNASPVQRAKEFLGSYSGLIGLHDATTELQTARISKDGAGITHVHLDQRYQGLPVFGARMVVHMNDRGILGTNGVFIGDLEGLSTSTKRSDKDLNAIAMVAAHKLHPDALGLSIESSRALIYRSGLLKSVTGKNYLAREVLVKGFAGEGIRERIILDANSGYVLNRINEIQTVLNREIYTPNLMVPPFLT